MTPLLASPLAVDLSTERSNYRPENSARYVLLLPMRFVDRVLLNVSRIHVITRPVC